MLGFYEFQGVATKGFDNMQCGMLAIIRFRDLLGLNGITYLRFEVFQPFGSYRGFERNSM